jgi:hypothetical protein
VPLSTIAFLYQHLKTAAESKVNSFNGRASLGDRHERSEKHRQTESWCLYQLQPRRLQEAGKAKTEKHRETNEETVDWPVKAQPSALPVSFT